MHHQQLWVQDGGGVFVLRVNAHFAIELFFKGVEETEEPKDPEGPKVAEGPEVAEESEEPEVIEVAMLTGRFLGLGIFYLGSLVSLILVP